MDIKALIKKYEELWNEHSPFYEPVPYTSMVELFFERVETTRRTAESHNPEIRS